MTDNKRLTFESHYITNSKFVEKTQHFPEEEEREKKTFVSASGTNQVRRWMLRGMQFPISVKLVPTSRKVVELSEQFQLRLEKVPESTRNEDKDSEMPRKKYARGQKC